MDLIAELEKLRRKHHICDDDYYSCPLAEGGCGDDFAQKDKCDCGADKYNAILDKIIAYLKDVAIVEMKAST